METSAIDRRPIKWRGETASGGDRCMGRRRTVWTLWWIYEKGGGSTKEFLMMFDREPHSGIIWHRALLRLSFELINIIIDLYSIRRKCISFRVEMINNPDKFIINSRILSRCIFSTSNSRLPKSCLYFFRIVWSYNMIRDANVDNHTGVETAVVSKFSNLPNNLFSNNNR